MKLADDIAHDAGTFLETLIGVEPELPHRVQKSAMNGLQAIAHVRQGPGGNDRKCIGEISLAQCIREGGIANIFRG